MKNEKHFPKTINQWEFDYGLPANLPRIIVARDFSPSSFKLKRGILLMRTYTLEISHICRCTFKVYIDKQILPITKSEYKEVNIKSEQTITNSKSPIENARKRWEWCSKLTIKTLGRHHLTSVTYLIYLTVT